MDEKEKDNFRNESEHKEQELKNETDLSTKRHYYGFGEKRQFTQQEKEQQPLKTPQQADFSEQSYSYAYSEQQYEQPKFTQQPQYDTGSSINNNPQLEYESTQPVNTIQLNKMDHAGAGTKSYKVTEKKSGKGKAITQNFLMFIASVLVVGLFMFASDKLNWFTGNEVSVQQTNGQPSEPTRTEGTVANYLEDRPDNISELFKAASPAVVKIETYSEVTYRSNNSLFNDPFFRQFFGDSYVPKEQSNEGRTELQQSGMGTGFFFDENGYILTNQHVIGDAKEIRVIVEGYDEPFIAELLGSSYELDLAVLKLNEDIKFPTLDLGSSESINIGDWVVAIGNPYGFDHTLTVGVISAKERPINIYDDNGERNYKNLLQTDASINPGNSGGPLLNLNGEVIGINTAVSSQAQGIGFAIPTSTISEVLDYLKNNEEIPAKPVPFVGINMEPLTEDMLEGTGLKKAEGVRIRSIIYGSPAYTGGLNQYDIITQIDDTPIKSSEQLQEYVSSKQVGDKIDMHVNRRGENIVITIEIGDKNHYNIN